jgi:putative ABC transport system permease protein
MKWLRQIFSRGRRYDDLSVSIQEHLDEKIDELMDDGMSREAAVLAARREFGNVALIEERGREAWQWPTLESFWSDLHFALRQLRKAPSFAIVSILALSLGIGAGTSIFSVIYAVLIRPLPFLHQNRLVVLEPTSRTGFPRPASYGSYLDEREQLQTVQVLAGYAGGVDSINLEKPTGSVSLRVVRGSDNFFKVFGVKPILGRTYAPGEDQPGKNKIAVLSHEVWLSDFGGQADVIGKAVRLDGHLYTVIGVMPSSFRFPLSAHDAIYTPFQVEPDWIQRRFAHWVRTVGLLKEGVSLNQTRTDLTRVLTNLGKSYPKTDSGFEGTVLPLSTQVNTLDSGGKVNGPLGVLGLAVLALVSIACVNVAGLLLARGIKREREIALRGALGARKLRLVRQMISESLVLSIAGFAGGILVAWLLLKILNVFIVNALARGSDVRLNLTAFAVALVLSVLTAVLASVAPAVRLSSVNPNRVLRTGGSAGTGSGQHRLRSGFVIVQVALSLLLLMVSGLLLQKLQDFYRADLGFDPKTILTTEINLSPGRYEGRDPLTTFYQPLLERISHLPGVQGVGVIDNLPVQGEGSNEEAHIAGQPPYPPNREMLTEIRFVSAGYFNAMGIKLIRGRMLSENVDNADNHTPTVVVNEAFRRKFFPDGANPIDARLDDNNKPEQKTRLVGLVTDVRQDLQQPPLAELDFPIDELSPKDRLGYLGQMSLVVRFNGDLAAFVPSLRNAVHETDPTVPFKTPETMAQVVSEMLVFQRMESWLFGIFAAFALLLAIIGLFGLVNYEVTLQTREIGIRMALGSTRERVIRQIIKRVALLMLIGIIIGWILTVAMEKVLAIVVEIHAAQDLLLGISLTIALMVIGILASLPSARRAASIDPMQALRSE